MAAGAMTPGQKQIHDALARFETEVRRWEQKSRPRKPAKTPNPNDTPLKKDQEEMSLAAKIAAYSGATISVAVLAGGVYLATNQMNLRMENDNLRLRLEAMCATAPANCAAPATITADLNSTEALQKAMNAGRADLGFAEGEAVEGLGPGADVLAAEAPAVLATASSADRAIALAYVRLGLGSVQDSQLRAELLDLALQHGLGPAQKALSVAAQTALPAPSTDNLGAMQWRLNNGLNAAAMIDAVVLERRALSAGPEAQLDEARRLAMQQRRSRLAAAAIPPADGTAPVGLAPPTALTPATVPTVRAPTSAGPSVAPPPAAATPPPAPASVSAPPQTP